MSSDLVEYLKYYKECYNPGYAVLVTGEWGSGKTHQVKNCIGENEIYYASLFGIDNIADLHATVLASMFPKQSKLKRIYGRLRDISIALGGVYAIGSILPSLANAVLRQHIKNDRILVFDDLERSGLALKETLGVINTYVEHHSCRVIVIAHDKEIEKNFREVKEKIFGQTIRVEPQNEEAFTKFCGQISGRKNIEFIRSHKPQIIDVFNSSEIGSLRILRHLVEDLSRLYDLLEEKYLRNVEALHELVNLFSALDAEVRAGNLLEDDLRNRVNAYYQSRVGRRPNDGSDGEVEEPNLLIADRKYPEIDLSSQLIGDAALVSMLINGIYESTELRASLDNSRYFILPNEVAPWKVVIRFDSTEDEELDAALERMLEQFDKRELTSSGEMLHVFCLRFLLSKCGVLEVDFPKIEEECMAYIDDLSTDGRLPPRELDWRWSEEFNDAYDGHMFWITEGAEDHFRAIFDHLINSREQALAEQFPEITRQLLNDIVNNGYIFAEKISYTKEGDNPYALIPVLAHIQPSDFVDAWLSSPKASWRTIFMALRERYEGNRLTNELASELDWLKAVAEEFDQRASQEIGLSAFRIERISPSALVLQH